MIVNYNADSVRRINTLHPPLIASAMKVYQQCQQKYIPIYIIWGRRSVAEQELLFRYSRSAPGEVITTTRPGYSAHNYGLALDFCLYRDTVLLDWYDCNGGRYWKWAWLKVMKLFELEGWESGWRWNNKFEPGHVQNLMGKNIIDYKHESDQRAN